MSLSLKEAQSVSLDQLLILSADELFLVQREVDSQLKKAQSNRDWLDYVLALRYQQEINNLEDQEGLVSKASLREGSIVVEIDLSQCVSWDQQELSTICERVTFNGNDPKEFVEVSYSISEEKYQTWDLSLKAIFDSARIIEEGTPIIKLCSLKEKDNE